MKKLFGTMTAAAALFTMSSCGLFGSDADALQSELDYLQQQLDDYLKNDTTQITVADLESEITNTYDNVKSSVVGVVTTISGSSTASGSGAIFDKVGSTYYVFTNDHVIEGGSSYKIHLSDGSSVNATLVGTDPLTDVAVLTFNSSNSYNLVTFADTSSINIGNFVLAVGSPLGTDENGDFYYYNSLTFGVVSGFRNFDGYDDGYANTVDYIQTDVAINSGNSGGPLFNLSGEVIGVNVLKLTSTGSGPDATAVEGMGFSIHLDEVKSSINSLAVGVTIA